MILLYLLLYYVSYEHRFFNTITTVSESQENGKIQEIPSINNANSDIQRRNLINDVSNNNSKIIGWPLYIFYQVISVLFKLRRMILLLYYWPLVFDDLFFIRLLDYCSYCLYFCGFKFIGMVMVFPRHFWYATGIRCWWQFHSLIYLPTVRFVVCKLNVYII